MPDEQDNSSNELGPVAESYAELQSLPLLFGTIRRPPAPPPASAWQAVRALLQAIEVALVNLDLLAGAAAEQARSSDWSAVAATFDWMVAFGKAWADLAWRILDVAPIEKAEDGPLLEITMSSNWTHLSIAEEQLATALAPLAAERVGSAEDWRTLTRRLLRYVMFQRAALEYSAVPNPPSDYDRLIRPEEVRDAVLDRGLRGDTVFTQFRAAHQMPEILVDATNDHIERALTHLRDGAFGAAALVLRRADRLLEATVGLTDLLVEQLWIDDYHVIRENLGLTSGSHSVGIHYHLMRDLVPNLVAVSEAANPNDEATPGFAASRLLVRSVARHVDRWRLAHLNLPRGVLGGAGTGTRSLTGSSDALLTVGRMREAAHARAPTGRPDTHFRATDWSTEALPLAAVERQLLERLALRTKSRFPDVQARTGRFGTEPGFKPPTARSPSLRQPLEEES